MPHGEIYDAGEDVDGCFKEEFRKYVREQDLLCQAIRRSHLIIFSWIFRQKQQLNTVNSAYNDIVDKIILDLESQFWGLYLVQFWKAEEVNSGNDFDQRHVLLTTKNQPFVLHGYVPRSLKLKNICSYRMRTADINCGDGEAGRGGVIGRVFRNKRMEFTPTIAYYSDEEYTNRNVALSCGIERSLVLPLCDISYGHPLGVIELVTQVDPRTLSWMCIPDLAKYIPLQELQRECFNCCEGLCGQYGMQDDFEYPVGEIKFAMELIGKSCNIVLGQTWMLCKLCNLISTCNKFGKKLSACYNRLGTESLFLKAESTYALQKGQGIIGVAASSPYNLVYCADVAKLDITKYPLSHFARKFNQSACFAIGLRCNYTADQIYVLELFPHRSHVEGRDLSASLVSIIQALGQIFSAVRLASPKEPGGYLPVLVMDAGIDVDGCFTKEFREYVRKQDLLCQRWEKIHTVDVDSDVNDGFKARYWAFGKGQQLDAMDSACVNIIDKMVRFFESRKFSGSFLLQFWKAEEVRSGHDFDQAHILLTTRNQPFLLVEQLLRVEELNKICTYRMRMVNINNEDRGVISRVFRNKRIEFTPDIAYYTYEEYPDRDLALSCHMKGSLVLPLSDSSGRSLGVVELVTPLDPSIFFWGFISDPLHEMLQRECFNCCKGRCGQYGIEDNFGRAVAEIKEVMELIGKSSNLLLGQTWMLCKVCNSISTCPKFGERLSACYQHFGTGSLFLEAESAYVLQKGQGIVGKAASSSYHLVYCEDVTKFSITEYPLAHFARKYNYSASFAISLQSIYTGDQVFVLEFFLDPRLVKGRDLWTALVSTIQTMRQKFQTFRFASGEEFGDIDTLSVQILDASSPDKFVTLRYIGLDLTSSVGENNLEVSRQYLLQHSIGETSTDGTYDPMIGVETSSPDSQTSSIQSHFQLKVKAYYGNVFIRFMLSACPTIHELNQHVSQKLQLEIGTYNFVYQDDDKDWILLTCDDDLREYAYSVAASGRSTSTMLIEPKHVS